MFPRLFAGSLLVFLALSLAGCGSSGLSGQGNGNSTLPDLVSQSVEGKYALSLGSSRESNATVSIDFDADGMRFRADLEEYGLLIDPSTKNVTWFRAGQCHWRVVLMPPVMAMKMTAKYALRKQQTGTDGDLRKFEKKIPNMTVMGKAVSLDVTAELDKSNMLHTAQVNGDAAGMPVSGFFNASSSTSGKPDDAKFQVPGIWGACVEATKEEVAALSDAAPLWLRAVLTATTGLDLVEVLAPSDATLRTAAATAEEAGNGTDVEALVI